MSIRGTTYAGMLGDWRRLLESLNANAAELGHLEGSRAKLEALLDQVVELVNRQAAMRAAKQEASKQIEQLMPQGQRLMSLLLAAVKEHYGIRSEKLAEFGLQPFRGRKVRLEPEAPEEDDPSEAPDSSRD